MKVLILGRDGQVGTALAGILASEHAVVAYGREGADLSRPDEVAQLVKRDTADVIINAAAYTAVDKAESEPELARTINAVAPGAIASAAEQTGAWFVHYSTDYVFNGEKTTPYVENDATGPLNVYGATKLAGEKAVADGNSRHLIFRTSWVHAPGPNNFIAKILSLAQSRDELRVIDDQIGAPTSARLIAEVTRLVINQIERDRPIAAGIYHLAAAGETSWNGYARHVATLARDRGFSLKASPESIAAVPSSAFPTPARRPLNSRLSTSKLRTALGIDLPDWREDILGTLNTILPVPSP